MADHVDITLRIDWRWKDAIEKHLRDETLQEHLENVLDELCNQLPEQEYERISCVIQSEAAAQRAEEEAARTYAAYHVVENGQEVEQYSAVYLAGQSGSVITPLSSAYGGSASCRVYVDGKLYLEQSVTME